jgi:hypothetical protein
MINRSAHKRCAWMVLVLFSAIAVTGNGLHFLPGVGHECRGNHRSLETSAESQRPTRANEFVRSAAEHDRNFSAISGDEDSDHCPVCQYFTQAQTVPLSVAFVIDSDVAEGRILTIRPLLANGVAGAYSSRAPPSCG